MMQSVLAELELLLAGFVERDLPGAFVVACDPVETLYLAQTLASLDERSESDLFLTFTETGPTAAALVDAVMENFALQRASLIEQSCPVAELAPLAGDSAAAPALRMRALIEHVLAMLPPGDHRLVWSLLPTELPPDFSAELAEPLLRVADDPRLRLVLRDDRSRPSAFAVAQTWPDEHVLAYSLDLSPADVVASAAATARDPERPAEERIQALMELAYLDLGYGRLADAEQKFRLCAEFHARTPNAPLEALALAGVADVQARNDPTAARRTYETALLKAAATQALPVTLQIAISLADTCRDLSCFADAEGYYRLADTLAEKLLRPHTRADVQESLGACRLALGFPAEAAHVWSTAAELCRALDYPTRLHSLLGRLADHHATAAPDRAKQRACLEEQAAVHARMQETCRC